MKISAEFKNGMCKVILNPEDEWEQKLLGAIAKGGQQLDADVIYTPDGHFTHNRCKVTEILISSHVEKCEPY